MIEKKRQVRKAYCIKCKKEFIYKGCRCNARCPTCNEKGTAVKIDNKGKIYY